MEQNTLLPWRSRLTLKAIFTLITVATLSTSIVQSQCPDNIDFSFQSQIFNFPILYPNCTEIEGYVKLSGDDIIHLNGLSNLESIGEYIFLDNCPSLENVDGLSNVSSLGSHIYIIYCDVLKNVSGFGNIQSYDGLIIWGCDSLVSLHGLENIASTANSFDVTGCPSLTDFSSFPNLNYIDNDCAIIGLESLNDLSGLENLDSVSGSLVIRGNHTITSIDGFESLKSVGDNLSISSNYSLESLSGLSNLHSVSSNLWLASCNSLTNLTGLDNLTQIGGDLSIDENNSLESLSGIGNIEAESIQNLSIIYNPQLSTCEVQSVCDYLANPNGDIQVYVNATGCNNSVEVEEACTVGVPEQEVGASISIYPNPTSSVISISGAEGIIGEVSVYNKLGQRVSHEQNPGKTIDVSWLHHGLYIVEVVLDGHRVRKKLIVQ